MKLTEEQSRAVNERGRIIVSASAGSGKTFVMIERLVSFILAGGSVENVLAVTFTTKAAAQMRDRLRAAIIKKIGESAGEERARLKKQLSLLPLADICTIHSFCARLVRTHFYAAGRDPSFRIVPSDDAEGRTISARALDETFEEAYEGASPDFMRLLSVYFHKKKDKKLRGLVLSLYKSVSGTEDEVAALMQARDADSFDAACGYLAEDYKKQAEFLLGETEKLAEYFIARGAARAEGVCADVKAAVLQILGAEDLFAMRGVTCEIRMMPRMTKAEGEERARLERLSAVSKTVKQLCTELREIGPEEEERARADDARGYASALCTLTLSYAEKYDRLKREANVLDYDDLERDALKVLKSEEVVCALKEKYTRLFVDEYQDVNPVQEKILSRIAGENVFLVGDDKQAIYGFRGSRSEFFKEKEKEYGHALRLTSNFRSSREVLDAVNRVFTPLIEGYAPMRGGERYEGYAGKVDFRFVAREKTKREEPELYSVKAGARGKEEDELAAEVERIVREELGKEWYDADEGKIKRVNYGDIAVLVRNNSGDAEKIVRLFHERSVPAVASSQTDVCNTFEARLLIDWISFLDNAEQDIPMAGAMLSAIGGFTDGELARIRLAYPAAYTFRKACELYCAKKRDELSRKLLAFYAKCERYRALCRIRTAAETCNLLLAEGLEAQILSKGDCAARLARVRRLIAEGEEKNAHEFLQRVKDGIDFSESGGENAVKVLTMHASKGLEFPIVILVSMDTSFHGGEKEDVMWTEKFFAAPKSYDTENKISRETLVRRASSTYEARKEVGEERNLLYVAMTRAKVRLHLLFEGKQNALSPEYARRFSDFFDFPACSDLWANSEKLPDAPSRTAYESKADEKETLLSVYGAPYPFAASVPVPVKSSATDLLREEEHDLRFAGGNASENAREEGIAYHAFLQNVVFGRPAGEELARMKAEGVLPPELSALLREEKLKEILALPCIRELEGKRVYREQTFLFRLPAEEIGTWKTTARDEVVFQGAIDLLCESEEGYLILDYKYSGKDDGALRERYAPQIALYKKAVARIMRVDESTVRARIVNIKLCREIGM